MKVLVNGEARSVADDTTVRDLLAAMGCDRPGVAVAVDGVVVPRARWASTPLVDGAVVEVLTAVQGG